MPPKTDEAALDAEFVAALVQFDEALRMGVAPTLNVARSESDSASEKPSDLALAQICLHELEAIMPRPANRSAVAISPEMPEQIGRFEILRVLGSGGFAVVYLARDGLLDRQVALKVPRWHTLASDELRRRFVREAQAAARLDHPHIAPTYEAGQSGDLPYIALAYCNGPTLAVWLRQRTEPVPSHLAAKLVADLAEAVHYSHQQGILHRDIKPANILLFPRPTPGMKAFLSFRG